MSTTVDDETILEVLRSNDAPRMTTTEVAGQLPVTRGTTRSRLQDLVDDDLLEREREGNNVVWWLPERADELEAWEPETETDETEAADAEEPDAAEAETDVTEPEPADSDGTEDTSVEVEATEQAESEAEDGDTDVEVEAVDDGIDEVEVTTPDEATEGQSPADRRSAELSEDEEGLRALALLAAAIVVFILFRKLLSGDGDGAETE